MLPAPLQGLLVAAQATSLEAEQGRWRGGGQRGCCLVSAGQEAGGRGGVGQGLRAWVVSLGRPGEERLHPQLSLRIRGSLEQKSGCEQEGLRALVPLLTPPRPVTLEAPEPACGAHYTTSSPGRLGFVF